jgi:hypothetical protein
MNPLSIRNPLAAAAALAVLGMVATPALAQVQPERPQEEIVDNLGEPFAETVAEQIEPDNYSVDAGITFATAYYFRGIIQEDDGLLNGGLITQPYIELGLPLLVSEDESFQISATVGTWNSVHSENDDDGVDDGLGPRTWYESDVYGGLTLGTGNFEIGVIYTFYLSPAGTFTEIQEVGGTIGYEVSLGDNPDVDDEFTLDLAFGAGVFFETDDVSGEDAYLELGVEPSFELEIDGFDEPVGLAFPVTVGLSLDDYYTDAAGDDEFLGYVSVAAAASFPLTPGGKYGAWSVTPAVEGLFLFAEGLEIGNDGDDVELIGSISLDLSF